MNDCGMNMISRDLSTLSEVVNLGFTLCVLTQSLIKKIEISLRTGIQSKSKVLELHQGED